MIYIGTRLEDAHTRCWTLGRCHERGHGRDRIMRFTAAAVVLLLSAMAACQAGELLVYEPFDYQPHNDEVLGRLEGRNGGLGFAEAWRDTDDGGAPSHAFIYDKRGNAEDLYDGAWGQGNPSWDGVVDNLPTMGGYVGHSDWNNAGDALHSTRKLSQSAGAMARKNGGVLWLSVVWHLPSQSFFAPAGIALASNGLGFRERAVAMNGKADAIGVGNGRDFRKRQRLSPIIWNQGEEVAGTPGAKIDPKKDAIVIIKFEFGETDTVRAWRFAEDEEMAEEAFTKNALSCSASVDEDTLEYLTIGTILKNNAVDEIRIGTTFQSVISGSIPPRQEVKLTKSEYIAKADAYMLEWTSNPGEVYGVYLAENAGGYKPCIAAAVNASADSKVTVFGPFPSPRKGGGDLEFEIGLPDTTPPVIDRVWGSGTSISLLFSEAMLPTTALSPDSYAVVQEGGAKLAVKSVRLDPVNGAVTLTTEKPLKPAAAHTITTRSLTDLANHPLVDDTTSFTTWDDDPEGVKVFILAGQSNMVGYGHSEGGKGGPGGPGSLRHLAVNNDKYPEYDYTSLLVDPAQPATSAWKTRPNIKVWWRNGVRGHLGGPVGKGNLGSPFRGANEKWFGPEYAFGQVVGDHYGDDDVLIVKAAWGGRKLVTGFRSPNATAARGGTVGPFYKGMFADIREVLGGLGKEFPEWDGRGYQIVGFAWHQGTSDKSPSIAAEEYKHNLPDFIDAVRTEFGKPDLPFVIATTGMSNVGPAEPHPYDGYHAVEKAQLWVAGVKRPANVLSDDTRGYWEEVAASPVNQGYHWNHNARSYFRVGLGLGKNMVKLLKEAP